MSGFVVREATVDDVPGMVDAYIAVAAEGRWIGGELPLDRDERIEAMTATIRGGDDQMFVAESDGEIIGMLGLHPRHGRADLGMAILEAWRGKGVGTAMMDAAIAAARARSLDKISLFVWPHNERAIKLYEKVGFSREGYHPKHFRRKNGEAWDAISMGLVLRED